MTGSSEHRARVAAAEAYEALHVPALFRQWAGPVLDASGVREGHRVLDVACGTGVLAREASDRVGTGGRVSGLDPDPGMLDVARRLDPGVAWKEGSAESLPYEDGSFDAVVSQFGLMFFAERETALREMVRVLAPGGRMAVAVWDCLESSAAYPAEVDLLERVAGKAAADALRAPFILGDAGELAALFARSGAPSVEVTRKVGRARFPSIRRMVEADLRGWLPVMGVNLDEGKIQEILTEAETVLREYVTEEGTVEFESPALIVAGTRE